MTRLILLASLGVLGALALIGTASAASVVNVTSGNFFFEDGSVGDGQIVINAGDQLRVEVVEGTRHTVDIEAFGESSATMDTGDVYVTNPLNTPGTYELFCRTHRNRGHTTTLVVVGQATTTTAAPTTTTTVATTTTTAAATTTTDAASTTTAGATTTSADTATTTTAAGATDTTVSGAGSSTPATAPTDAELEQQSPVVGIDTDTDQASDDASVGPVGH